MERISKAGIRYLEPCLTLGEITDDFLKEEGIEFLLHNVKEAGKEYDRLLELCHGTQLSARMVCQ